MQLAFKPLFVLFLSIYIVLIMPQNSYAQVIVQDSSFEIGHPNPYWVEQSKNFSSTICNGNCGNVPGVEPLTGSYFLWLGGSNILEEGSASQQILIPSSSSAAILSFHLKTPIVAANVDDYFKVFMDSTVIFHITAADSSTYKNEYKEVKVDVSAYANGKHHNLKFFGHQTGSPKVTHYLVDDVSIKTTVGFQKYFSLKDIKIYPNPASDFIYLKVNKPKNIVINITSVEGKILKEQKFVNVIHAKLDISKIPKGFYLITIEDKNRRKVQKKLIIN